MAASSDPGQAKALEPERRQDPDGWVARWMDGKGELHEAGLHPARDAAEAVASAMAAEDNRKQPRTRRRTRRKRYARSLKPVPVRRANGPIQYQGRLKTANGKDLRVPGLHPNATRAKKASDDAAAAANQNGSGTGDARPVGHYVDHWPSRQSVETLGTHKERLRILLRVLPHPDVPVDELTRDDVYEAKDALVDEGYHPDYIRQILQSLSALIEILREHDTIATKNVASRIKITEEDRKLAFANRDVRVARKCAEAKKAGRKPRRESQPPRAVTAEEFHATIRFTSPFWQARLKLAAATGVRPGELYAANRRNVHRDRQLIDIAENVSRGGELLDGTKNTYILQPGHRSRLTIFPASLLEELDATGIPVDGYWIRAPDGGLINANNFRNRVFKPMMEAAVSAKCADYWTLKDLRHTFSTQLLGAGLPITHVARWMGDSVTIDDGVGGRRRVRSQAVTVYEHPDEAHVARAADVMRTYLRVGQQKLFGS